MQDCTLFANDLIDKINLIFILNLSEKMGCSGSKENTLERPGSGKLTVWGDYFNSDTRTILSILFIAGIPH
jgi:hypothetical protein